MPPMRQAVSGVPVDQAVLLPPGPGRGAQDRRDRRPSLHAACHGARRGAAGGAGQAHGGMPLGSPPDAVERAPGVSAAEPEPQTAEELDAEIAKAIALTLKTWMTVGRSAGLSWTGKDAKAVLGAAKASRAWDTPAALKARVSHALLRVLSAALGIPPVRRPFPRHGDNGASEDAFNRRRRRTILARRHNRRGRSLAR